MQRIKFLQLISVGHLKYQQEGEKVVIKAAASHAYDDMNQIRFIWNKNFPGFKEKREVLPQYLEILDEFNYAPSKELIHRCYKLFGYNYEDNPNKYLGTPSHGFSLFGVCQKLVTMTFKYLLAFNELLERNIDYSQCYCPVDSIILRKLEMSHIIWTKMTEEEFDEVQSIVRIKLNDMDLTNVEPILNTAGLLAYDFLCWE